MTLRDRLDAFYTFGATGKYILSKQTTGSDINFVKFRSSPYFACFSKALPHYSETSNHFNLGLEAIRADGTYESIMRKYR